MPDRDFAVRVAGTAPRRHGRRSKAGRAVRVVAFPRDQNPYQANLYSHLHGVSTRYVGDWSPSQTANVFALPAEVLLNRLRGARILHLHWVFGFRLPGTSRIPWLRWVSLAVYKSTVQVARAVGMKIVWTAHNTLPHDQVFPCDLTARRWLVRRCDLVIVHSRASLTELNGIVGTLRRVAVIPHGPVSDAARPVPGDGRTGPISLLVFGRIARYKGIDAVLAAYNEVADQTTLELTFAGECPDATLRAALSTTAEGASGRVRLRLEHVPDAELGELFAAHDAVLLPYSHGTTSGIGILACELGAAVLAPRLPAFDGLPCIEIGTGADGIRDCLLVADRTSRHDFESLGREARQWAQARSNWDVVGRDTATELRGLIGDDFA
jgi:glycosyltransferase involved in cell wall biosynthesis